jgi:glutathione S-transferase
MIVLHDNALSLPSQRVRLALLEKGLQWEEKSLALDGDHLSPEYLKINPKGSVPSLVHEGHVMVEATVINHYIDDAFAEKALMPSAPLRRARIHALSKMIDEGVDLACERLSLATVYREAIIEGDAAVRARFGRDSDAVVSDIAMAGLHADLAKESLQLMAEFVGRVERYVAKTPYLAGESISLADIAVFPCLARLEEIALERLWRERSDVNAWFGRMNARESVVALRRQYKADGAWQRFENYKPC